MREEVIKAKEVSTVKGLTVKSGGCKKGVVFSFSKALWKSKSLAYMLNSIVC